MTSPPVRDDRGAAMRVVIDMNLSPRWAPVLRAAGHDAVHWADVGAPSATDATLLAWAASEARIVLTHDLDFGAILAASADAGPSVVQLRTEDVLPESAGGRVLAVLEEFRDELRAGALVSLDERRARVTVLPLLRRHRPAPPG